MNTKNKVGLYLIIAGAALLLLTTVAIFSVKKSFINCFTPENPFEEDLEISLTDAPAFIDDTISNYASKDMVDMAAPVAAPAAKPVVKPAVKTTAKPVAEKHAINPKPKPQPTTNKTYSTITDNYTGKTSTNKPLPSGTNEFTIDGTKIMVEFWNPDKNFKGYHLSMSGRTLKLFGIDQLTPLRFTPYLLKEERDIEPLQQYSE